MIALLAGISVGIPSISWAIVRCVQARVTQQLTQEALKSPAAQPATILRAAAELASKMSTDRAPGKSITLFSSGRRRDG
jgi:hypothetical protein